MVESSVSYTHLDVYKRQVHTSAEQNHRLFTHLLSLLSIIHFFWVKIVVSQTLKGHLFPTSAWFPIITVRVNGYPSSGSKFSPFLNVFRVHQTNQIFHDNVYTVLMEISMVAEAEQIQLQRFTLHQDVYKRQDVLCLLSTPPVSFSEKNPDS